MSPALLGSLHASASPGFRTYPAVEFGANKFLRLLQSQSASARASVNSSLCSSLMDAFREAKMRVRVVSAGRLRLLPLEVHRCTITTDTEASSSLRLICARLIGVPAFTNLAIFFFVSPAKKCLHLVGPLLGSPGGVRGSGVLLCVEFEMFWNVAPPLLALLVFRLRLSALPSLPGFGVIACFSATQAFHRNTRSSSVEDIAPSPTPPARE